MVSHYRMQYYHSYQGNDSFQGCYCCALKDGGELIVLAIKGGVEYIIQKDGKQRIMNISLGGTRLPIPLMRREEQSKLYWDFRILREQ